MIERRKHERYHVKTGTFALLRSTSIEFSKIREMGMGEIGFAVIKSKPIKMGQIINISMNGLAFEYIERRDKPIKVFKLDILYAQDAIESEIPLNTFTIRRCGVEFGELTSNQKSRLEFFLNKHTIMQEQMPEDCATWEDHNFNAAPETTGLVDACVSR
jgi:hypothetical protein